jgi:hypothetical protein
MSIAKSPFGTTARTVDREACFSGALPTSSPTDKVWRHWMCLVYKRRQEPPVEFPAYGDE